MLPKEENLLWTIILEYEILQKKNTPKRMAQGYENYLFFLRNKRLQQKTLPQEE